MEEAQGKGLRQIARELNSLNIRTPRGAHCTPAPSAPSSGRVMTAVTLTRTK
jgi:hypothetical protein